MSILLPILTWHCVLIALAVIVLMYFVKAGFSYKLNGFRAHPLIKQIVLPGIATLIGGILGIWIHPACCALIDSIIYGLVVGFFATSVYRFLVSYIEKQTGIRVALSSPPPEDVTKE